MSVHGSEATILVLGGTTEGRAVAHAATQWSGLQVISSLAGRVHAPLLLPGVVREGGFGGVEGLTAWLREHRCRAIVDATHPFAATMSSHAAQAAHTATIPLVRFTRPPWSPCDLDRWIAVSSVADAALMLDRVGTRALITTGRQSAGAYHQVRAWCLLRSIDPPAPEVPLPPHHRILLDRGPFTLEGELDVMAQHLVDVVVTKNSGGDATAAKLEAARTRGIPVVMVARPPDPAGVPVVHHIEDVKNWLEQVVG